MPESATVEDVEQLHVDAWRMGLKAVAIYRDNCKVAQPLSSNWPKEKTIALRKEDEAALITEKRLRLSWPTLPKP